MIPPAPQQHKLKIFSYVLLYKKTTTPYTILHTLNVR